jgi:hypothetical protein
VLNSLANVDTAKVIGVYVDIKSALPNLKEVLQHELVLPEVIGVKNSTNTYVTFILEDEQIELQLGTIAIIQTNSYYFSIDQIPTNSKYRLNISTKLLAELDVVGYISISSL